MLILVVASLLAFYLAWNLGANDVANSMGTSVGSKAVTLRQALLIAGILEFAGAVLFGREVSTSLATKLVNSASVATMPAVLITGMLSVLLACGVWLNIATFKGLPVSSSHAVVGAIAGFACVAFGPQTVAWRFIGVISLSWVVTPLISAAIAALFYSQIKYWILDHPDAEAQLREWIPWLSVALFSSFGIIVFPTVVERFFVMPLPVPSHTVSLLMGTIAVAGLTFYSWFYLEALGAKSRESGVGDVGVSVIQKPPLQTLSSSYVYPLTESLLARLQVLSACFVAFAHGSNDVGNAIAPLAVIAYTLRTGSVPLEGFQVPLWILVLGGTGIVIGLAVWGKKVIATIGEGILPLQPSGGFCAELATGITILVASWLGLPVSTSHALVGSVVGIGLIQNPRAVRLQTLRAIGLAWVVTVPLAALIGAVMFSVSHWLTLSYD
ncbi:MAG: inorganic phosphate transporter [Leptolyngbya sp. BL-A-14]